MMQPYYYPPPRRRPNDNINNNNRGIALCRVVAVVFFLQLAMVATFEVMTDSLDETSTVGAAWLTVIIFLVITSIATYICIGLPNGDEESSDNDNADAASYYDDMTIPLIIVFQMAIGITIVFIVGQGHWYRAAASWALFVLFVAVVLTATFCCTLAPPPFVPSSSRHHPLRLHEEEMDSVSV